MGDEAGSSSLKRVLDLKLVYDCLADSSSGLVRVDLIASWWPSSAIAASKLPRGCVEFWRESANAEGLIDWESFSSSLERALKADASRLHEGELLRSEDQSLVSGKRQSIAHVTAGEIERFLSLSHAGSLVRALSRAGRDVHRWQVSIHKLNSSGFGPAGAKTRTGGEDEVYGEEKCVCGSKSIIIVTGCHLSSSLQGVPCVTTNGEEG